MKALMISDNGSYFVQVYIVQIRHVQREKIVGSDGVKMKMPLSVGQKRYKILGDHVLAGLEEQVCPYSMWFEMETLVITFFNSGQRYYGNQNLLIHPIICDLPFVLY